jgi:hypothetical protein
MDYPSFEMAVIILSYKIILFNILFYIILLSNLLQHARIRNQLKQ